MMLSDLDVYPSRWRFSRELGDCRGKGGGEGSSIWPSLVGRGGKEGD